MMNGSIKNLEIFRSQKPFDDRRIADDMHYGDMTEETLKQRFGLIAVSDRVDCYSFRKLTHSYASMPILSRDQAAAILFDQLRTEASFFAWGKYRSLIIIMLNHMQYRNGTDFHSDLLDQAYKEMILGDKTSTSALNTIRSVITNLEDWNSGLTQKSFNMIRNNMHLPKFSRFADNYNGLGVTVHEVNSTKIIIEKIDFNGDDWKADILFVGQDHFGIDQTDIGKTKFKYLTAFRIWFVLQRYNKLAYKPFLVNMKANITISSKDIQ